MTSKLPLGACWRQQAEDEHSRLTLEQRQRLWTYGEDSWDAGALLAWLEAINEERRRIKLSIKDLMSFFDVRSPSTVSNWFITGKISAVHFTKLISMPHFRNTRPSEEDAATHGYRESITWVRVRVLQDEKCRRRLAFDELMFLHCLHAMDEPDVDRAFELLPERLKQQYPDHDATWLLVREREWGTPFRIAAREETDDED